MKTPGSEYSLGWFGLLTLEMFMNSVGKTSYPNYKEIRVKYSGFELDVNVAIVWFVSIL